MTPPSKPEHAPDDQPDEPSADTRVETWRRESLTRAGYTEPVLTLLAAQASVDLHDACDLLAKGCDEMTAWRILT